MMPGLDVTLLHALAAEPGSPVAHIALALTRFGDADPRFVIIAGLAGALGWKRGWRTGLLYAGIVLGGALVIALLKVAIGRPRPDLLPHQDHVTSASMPSGHAGNTLIVLLAAARLWAPSRALAVLAIVLAVAVGVSRVMLGVHWPSDVIAGWAVGFGWVAGCLVLARRGRLRA